ALVERPARIDQDNHLLIRVDDIICPMDGYEHPCEEHVARLISFARSWDRSAPMVIHCYAGISRSTASAFAAACALNPDRHESAGGAKGGWGRRWAGFRRPPIPTV